MGLFLCHVFTSGGLLVCLIYTLFFSCNNFVWSLNVFLFYSSFFHKSSFQECILKSSSWVGVCSCCFQVAHCTFKWTPLFWGSPVLKFFTLLVASVSSYIKMILEGSYSHLYFRMSIFCQLFLFIGCLWVYSKMFYI